LAALGLVSMPDLHVHWKTTALSHNDLVANLGPR
jgi:hypothetical protein